MLHEKVWAVPALFIGLLLASAHAHSAVGTDPVWTFEKIDNSSNGNRMTAIQATDDGLLHTVYTGCSDAACKNNELFYGVRGTDGKWVLRSIDADHNDTGWTPSMDIDAHGVIRIAYGTHYNLPMLRLATLAPGQAWRFETLGKYAGGYWTSLKTVGDTIYLGQTSFPTSNINAPAFEVDTFAGGAWQSEILDNGPDAGWFTMMTLDNDKLPLLTYVEGSYPEGTLKMARKTAAGKWEITTIDDESVKSSAAVDAQGFVHIAYTKTDEMYLTTKDLYYATNAPDGKWKQKKLDGGQFEKATTGFFPSLMIDRLGAIHILYSDDFHQKLSYARNLTGAWDGWEIRDVTKNFDDCYYTSMTEDLTGRLHIVCDNGSEIHYAQCDGCTLR